MVRKEQIETIIMKMRLDLLDELSNPDDPNDSIAVLRHASRIMGARIAIKDFENKINELNWEENNG